MHREGRIVQIEVARWCMRELGDSRLCYFPLPGLLQFRRPVLAKLFVVLHPMQIIHRWLVPSVRKLKGLLNYMPAFVILQACTSIEIVHVLIQFYILIGYFKEGYNILILVHRHLVVIAVVHGSRTHICLDSLRKIFTIFLYYIHSISEFNLTEFFIYLTETIAECCDFN